jgi:hypothetical protein
LVFTAAFSSAKDDHISLWLNPTTGAVEAMPRDYILAAPAVDVEQPSVAVE